MMSRDLVLQKVKTLVGEQLFYDEGEIKETSKLVDDLGADSLDLIEFVMMAEEEFDLSIPDPDAEKFQTVGDVVNYVHDELKRIGKAA